MSAKLVIVTASTNLLRAKACMDSWGEGVETIVVLNSPGSTLAPTATLGQFTILSRKEYLGTVPAFAAGVDYALEHTDAEVIACLHDDLAVLDPDWVPKVLRRFQQQPGCGLLGFGGAIGLGDGDLYQKPYQPVQLARVGFRSNLTDAEVHGARSILAERVACLDGFSQIGRREYWLGAAYVPPTRSIAGETSALDTINDPNQLRPWQVLKDLGITHHLYDGLLGAIAARYGWEVWYEPIRCRHYGGQTAVGDAGYQKWAEQQTPGGDHGFWEQAHQIGYEAFRDILPLRI